MLENLEKKKHTKMLASTDYHWLEGLCVITFFFLINVYLDTHYVLGTVLNIFLYVKNNSWLYILIEL